MNKQDENQDFGLVPLSEFYKTIENLNKKIEETNNRLNKLIDLTEKLALIVKSKE